MSSYYFPRAVPIDVLAQLNERHLWSDDQSLVWLRESYPLDASAQQFVQNIAAEMIVAARQNPQPLTWIERMTRLYPLNTTGGVKVMTMAEALLRIPDATTAQQLVQDLLTHDQWQPAHSAKGLIDASMVQALKKGRSVWNDQADDRMSRVLNRLLGVTKPVAIKLLKAWMSRMAMQFVAHQNIRHFSLQTRHDDLFSFDMLGEAARTRDDAERYFKNYMQAIQYLAKQPAQADVMQRHGVSIKLSSLHPRYEWRHGQTVTEEVTLHVVSLLRAAMTAHVPLTIDAEESDKLELAMDIIERVLNLVPIAQYHGFGIAVQAYLKRSACVIDWAQSLAQRHHTRLAVRVVKGAYWDSEVKRAQEQGLSDYPVWLNKAQTDAHYLCCAEKLLKAGDDIYPMFATHNAHTIAAVHVMARRYGVKHYEFQRLYGMGERIYAAAKHKIEILAPVRIYAPVGDVQTLLPYLVRRLIENGANSSFLHDILHDDITPEQLVRDPLIGIKRTTLPRPTAIFLPQRLNSHNMPIDQPLERSLVVESMAKWQQHEWSAACIIDGKSVGGTVQDVLNPANHQKRVGCVKLARTDDVKLAMQSLHKGFLLWSHESVEVRAQTLRQFADVLQQQPEEWLTLLQREAGKTIDDAMAELREAIDFCRFYASEAERLMQAPVHHRGIVGEENWGYLKPRGVVACISPWNFPLAIFIGQVAAALVMGNTVLAKPAEQTPLIADRAVRTLHQCGVPTNALALIQGDGAMVGPAIMQSAQLSAVVFTGSTATAKTIQRELANRDGEMLPLIAETGGINAMLVDSTALPEQVVADILQGGFRSAGQRCSATRIVYVQREIADRLLELLAGAMAELRVGDPTDFATDVGPVISTDAARELATYIAATSRESRKVAQSPLPRQAVYGNFVPPTLFEIDRSDQLSKEVFGPVVHVLRYSSSRFDTVLDEINASGFGLTFALHSRLPSRIEHVRRVLRVGNVYVNRSQIGAVVESQPFGGMGLSGTGPKAGGKHYLMRFVQEQTVTINTVAAGGNATLLTQNLDE